MVNNTELEQTIRSKIETYVSIAYKALTAGPAIGGSKTTEEYIIRFITRVTEEYVVKLLTRFAISLSTAFWSIKELFDYINNRRARKDLVLV